MTPPPRLWLDDPRPGLQTRCFRRAFNLEDAAVSATIRLYAEARYLLWVNGRFVAAGPIAHHPHQAPFDTHDLSGLLQPGRNVLAVLVADPQQGTHQHVPTGEPGLSARLEWTDAGQRTHHLETDAQWRVTADTGWARDVPKRGWALGPIDVLHLDEAPVGWQAIDFDDAGWSAPTVGPLGGHIPGGVAVSERPVPTLRHRLVTPDAVRGLDAVNDPVGSITATQRTEAIGEEVIGLTPLTDHAVTLEPGETPAAFTLRGLGPDAGAAVHLDLGKFYVGQLVLRCAAPSAGVIDIAWGEACDDDGRALCLRKGTSYVDRIYARPGPIDWRPIGFSGMQYLTLVFRGFVGDLQLQCVGLDATEPDLNWDASFRCSDQTLNDIFDVCVRTIRVGNQDALMDCPTREQGTYIGDGLPVSQWIARLTGDTRYWTDLIGQQFARQADSGLVRSTPYSCFDDTLIDYVLIAVIGTRDYLNWTGDAERVRALLPAMQKAIGWFDRNADEDGLLTWRWVLPQGHRPLEAVYDPKRPKIERLNLFIDHPGLGWHNPHDAGIDRRGINTAIHTLLVMAHRAIAEVAEQLGETTLMQPHLERADALAATLQDRFFDKQLGVFVDGQLDGSPLPQVSEQTNVWAALAGLIPSNEAAEMIQRLTTQDDPAVARSGFYFWIYQLEVMARLDLMPLALDSIRRLWTPILERGGSTVWETTAGDELDSFCHPWSCTPASFLLTHVLGLGGLEDEAAPTLRPRPDLLPEASGQMFTRHGLCRVAWTTEADGGVRLTGQLPEGVTAGLRGPNGEPIATVSGHWTHTLPGAG